MYAPYKDRERFWDTVEVSGILNDTSLILAGDLNCTLCIEELWGQSRVADKMAHKLREIIFTHNLIDICPPKLRPPRIMAKVVINI